MRLSKCVRTAATRAPCYQRSVPASVSCATCRKPIAPGVRHVRCSVVSCNTGRQKLRFCNERCWQAHVPTARHRKANFVEEGGED